MHPKLYCYVTSFTVPQVIACLGETAGKHRSFGSVVRAVVSSLTTWIILGVIAAGFAMTYLAYSKYGPGSNDYQQLNEDVDELPDGEEGIPLKQRGV